FGEAMHEVVILRRSGTGRRIVMVECKDDAFRMPNAGSAHLLEVRDRHRRRGVGADDEIGVADHDVAGARLLAGFLRENLFGDGPAVRPHRHRTSSAAAGAASVTVTVPLATY